MPTPQVSSPTHPSDQQVRIEAIQHYAQLSQALSPNEDEVKALSYAAFEYSTQFLNELPQAPVFYFNEATNTNSLEDINPEENPGSIGHIIKTTDHLNQSGLNTASAAHFGYVPAGGIYAASIADYLVSVANRFPTVHFCAPAIVELENTMIKWLCSLFGYTEKAGGVFTSGGSLATLTAIVAARDAHEICKKEPSKSVVYLTAYSHHCIQKGLKIAGLGQVQIRMVNVDESLRMKPEHLNSLIENDLKEGLTPWMAVATAGSTDIGAVDPVDAIAQIGHRFKMWVHVDAAYGGFFILTEKGKALFKNFHQADSIVVDPHKSMFLPYGIGTVLVKDLSCLLDSFSYDANYLRDYADNPGQVSPADLSPELTRNFRGLKLWLPLKLYGIKPFRAALEEKLLLAQYFYTEIQKINGVEVVCQPELSIVTFRYVPPAADSSNAFNTALIKNIQATSKVFMSSTLINQNVYLRMACLSFRSHLAHVQLAIEVITDQINRLITGY